MGRQRESRKCGRCGLEPPSRERLSLKDYPDGELRLCRRCVTFVEAEPELVSAAAVRASIGQEPLPMGARYGPPKKVDWHSWVYGGERNPEFRR